MEGDLIFVRGIHFTDKIIERMTNSPYSHVAIFVSDTDIVEAVPPKIRRVKNTYTNADIIKVPYASQIDRDRSVKFALSLIGRGYSFMSLFSDFLQWAGNPIILDWSSSLNCAEACGLCINCNIDIRGVSPGSLAEKVNNLWT